MSPYLFLVACLCWPWIEHAWHCACDATGAP